MNTVGQGNGFDWDYVSNSYFSTDIDKMFDAYEKSIKRRPSQSSAQRKYYEENKTEIQAKSKKYYQEQKPRILKRQGCYEREKRSLVKEQAKITGNLFGKMIKEAREAANLSQADLGRMICVSISSVGRYETGLAYPKPSNLEKLADALKIPIESMRSLKSHFFSNFTN